MIFAGRVTDLTNARWLVAGIPVAISNRTDLPDEQVNLNDAVRVTGHTRADGTVDAERLELLPQDAVLPISEMEKPEPETHETPEPREEQNSGSGSRDEAKTPESGASSQPESKSFDGKVESIQGEIWIINGQAVDVSQAEIKGVPTIGADANVKGYITVDGKFVATKIEFESESGSGSNDSGGSGSNDNGSDSGGSGSNDNGDDNGNGSGGDDNGNSGSGGGGSGSGGSNDGNGHP